jgi:hypothetical protein
VISGMILGVGESCGAIPAGAFYTARVIIGAFV